MIKLAYVALHSDWRRLASQAPKMIFSAKWARARGWSSRPETVMLGPWQEKAMPKALPMMIMMGPIGPGIRCACRVLSCRSPWGRGRW